jgi:hypothetical protein
MVAALVIVLSEIAVVCEVRLSLVLLFLVCDDGGL